ncbi:serine/threonine transporter SstT [uncultured Fusobacterium sp.]|jgi:serine/threonine transporter|uniref:serine/threonine transporter SstT n=1 Tax=uncultured Fusobacterium sp. TaxID=159267 RepID=UPI0015A5C30E|nr:serine/threonine transporter SstT [uncultured Fusobacterium sp.]
MKNLYERWIKISLIKRIIVGLIVGVILVLVAPEKASSITILGDLFVGALKAIAPLLVFVLVMAAVLQHKKGQKSNMKLIIFLYLLGTFLAASVAVVGSFLFPVDLILKAGESSIAPPENIAGVLKALFMNLVENPVKALLQGNYIGILFWSALFGFFLRESSENSKKLILDVSDVILKTVKTIIEFAPFGIMGLIFNSLRTSGFASLLIYGKLILLLLGCMGFVTFVINPLIAYFYIRQNPYPLIMRCLKDSGVTAFFTRSSAANIPVNMNLCENLGLDKEVYSVSIPLGATINMGGAAITISIFALSAAHTLNIQVDIFSALLLSVLSAISACGASGVAGGSLLLVPLACSLFGIPNDIAMQVVGVGFIIGVIQDSCETALNSSTDVLFTCVAEFANWRKEGKTIVVERA